MKKEVSGQKLKYLLSVPEGKHDKNGWPLLLFLHGAGERGSDLEKVKVHGPPKLINKFPQLKNEIEFLDDKKKINLIQQAKEWSESLERDDIRQQTTKSLPQISKIIKRGIENAKITKINPIKDEKKHKKAEERNESDWEEVVLENQKYRYQIITEYDESNTDLYFAEFPDSKNNFKIKVYINLKHKFAERFFTHNNDRNGFLTLITFFAICEAQVRHIDGSKDAALMRLRLNSICENIPPRT